MALCSAGTKDRGMGEAGKDPHWRIFVFRLEHGEKRVDRGAGERLR